VVTLRPYSQTLNPPGPVAEVILVNTTTGSRTATLPGKMDTGSDVTLVPAEIMRKLAPKLHGWSSLYSYDQTSQRCPMYYLKVAVEGHEVMDVPCIATNRANVLLGRDVLNQFVITLDGKNLAFSLTQ
jgi:predicted aspartyl protease